MSFGIEALEFYAPKTYVDQSDLGTCLFDSEQHYGVSEGKYTKGLGQL
jgi:3-hydroxy-3-methylglutaryl CoA synthase